MLKRKTPLKRTPLKPKAEPKEKVKKKPVSARKSLNTKAEVLARKWFKRGGVCEAAGAFGIACSPRLEWAHLKSRGILFLKFHPENACCLCSMHHFHFTNHPDRWIKWTEEHNPGVWNRLNQMIQERQAARVKPKLEDIYAEQIEFFKRELKEEGL